MRTPAPVGGPGAHHLKLYQDDDDLGTATADFLAEGVARNEGLVVIATPAHWKAIARALLERGLDPRVLTGRGQLVAVDAQETLERILQGKALDGRRFERLVSGLVGWVRSNGHGKVRAYGELVDLLWLDGRLDTALRLEAAWEGFLAEEGVDLLCGYRMDALADQGPEQEVRKVHRSGLLPADRQRLDGAVAQAVAEVFGEQRAQALVPLVHATVLPVRASDAERTVAWLRRNLPSSLQPVLVEARRRLEAPA